MFPRFYKYLVILLLLITACRDTDDTDQFVLEEIPDWCDSFTAAAGAHYRANKSQKVLLGKQYREEWTTPVKVPCLDLSSEAGGLIPIQKGGGKQTRSLRLINPEGIQFTLRSIDKYPETLLPEVFRRTWVEDMLKDLMSTAHPYGALVVPQLAEAVGVYHTNPKLVFIPDSPLLREYRTEFGGMLAFLEIRPDEDLSGFPRFGNSANIVGTDKLYEKLRESHLNKVDQKMYARARLFDMLLNDWDRHEDQWRWAEFQNGNGYLYQPVPRDRDQVFVKFEGAVPYIFSRKWGYRNIRNFDNEIDDLEGLNLNAYYLDRVILTAITKEDMAVLAEEIKARLTDSVINIALLNLPPEIYKISGEELMDKLKSRRDKLPEYADEYYLQLFEKVNILGSDQDEIFSIERNRDQTIITVYRPLVGDVKVPSAVLYRRVFDKDVTREIYIHSFGGNNLIEIHGPKNDIDITIYSEAEDIVTGLDSTDQKIKLIKAPSRVFEVRQHKE